MRCSRCQHENPPPSRFCFECGARLAPTCSNCGTELPTGVKFCNQCGQPVTGPAPVESRFASPQAYTPKHLAEKILTSKGALEGERKQVTVLFADLKGSMELLADRDPEEARRLLDPVLERMMEAVHHYEGTVNQVMGDGIMALFGAPLAHEDHAVRTCYAALGMQESVKRYADEVHRTEGVPIQIRVGLNSGEVVVRSIGSDLRMDYTAVGQTTHLAARMEQLAMAGSILLTADTLRLAEGYVAVRPLGPIPIKGLVEPVEVYELTGAGPARTKMQAAAARGLTRFVGRDAEMEALRQTLDKARAGHGQVVAVVGEPGVGKSRLFWEFTHSHRTHGWLILESGSVSYGKATPYLPVIDLLKAYFQVEAREDGRRVREKVTGKLLTLDRALEPALPAFLTLLDVAFEDPAWQALEPSQRRQKTLDACRRLLLRESQVQPLMVVFEDLHWIDSETQALLHGLVESLPTARLLLLVNYRPEYQHGWGGKTYYTQLRIDPLPPESADALLEALLGTDPSLRPLKQLLIDRTEGNPFFLEESVRTLVETRMLVGEGGGYRLAKPAAAIQVPATVQTVLAARIDRLPAEEKKLLQTAAVVGKDVPFALLQAVAGLEESALRRQLSHLQAAEFLYEAGLFPELEYTFKHALTHEVAYGSVLQERRCPLHARIMEAIERLYAERLAEQVDHLAHHAFRGEAWEKAVAYLREAGVKAASRSAHREALAWFEQALTALQRLPETRENLAKAIDLWFSLRTSLLALGELNRLLSVLQEGETIASTLGDRTQLGRISSFMATSFCLTGQYDRAIQSGERALAIASEQGDFALEVATNIRLGQTYYALGNHRRAVEILRRTVASLEDRPAREHAGLAGLPVVSRTFLVWSLSELGEFAEAILRGEEAVRIAEEESRPSSLIVAYFCVGFLYVYKGDFERVIQTLKPSLVFFEGGNFPLMFPAVASQLGWAYILSGRVADGLPLLEQAVEKAESTGLVLGHSDWLWLLSDGYLRSGRLQEATAVAQRALQLSVERKERGWQAWALMNLGNIASNREPVDAAEAEDSYRQATDLANELGMRPLQAHCHLGLGALYGKIDKAEQARVELSRAVELYRAMDMRFWPEQAEAVLQELE